MPSARATGVPAGEIARLQDRFGLLLRFGDVGLVERIDAEDRTGDGGRELPAEELRAERSSRVLKRSTDGRPSSSAWTRAMSGAS